LVKEEPLLGVTIEETPAKIHLFSHSLLWAEEEAGMNTMPLDCLEVVAVVAFQQAVPAHSVKETWEGLATAQTAGV
jgi:hypothetical protein